MEPIETDGNKEFQEVIDDRLEKVVQDFNEFRERMTQSSSNGAVKLEDIIDLYINNGGENLYDMQQNTQGQVTTQLENINNSESTPPPHHIESKHGHSIHEFDINRQIQDSGAMIQEMIEDTSQIDIGSFPESSQNPNINPNVGMASSSIRVMHIRYGDLNCHEAAYNIIGCVFGDNTESDSSSIMRFVRDTGVGGKFFRPHLGVKERGDRTTRRANVKRKCRGAIETEEETSWPMKKTKTNNREAATRANR